MGTQLNRTGQEIEKGDTLPTYSESTIVLYDLFDKLSEEKRREVIRQIECLLSDE